MRPGVQPPSRALIGALFGVLLLIAILFLVGPEEEDRRGSTGAGPGLSGALTDPLPSPVDSPPVEVSRKDINRASVADLMDVEGLGEVLARRIIRERDRRGGFESVDDALDVEGIGIERWKALRERFTVARDQQDGK